MRATSDWLSTWARFRPEAEAIYDVARDRRWSWSELEIEARRQAGRLRAEGVGPGDRVAVVAHNRAETFTLLFAVAHLGAVLVPLNWRLSPVELRWQLEHCGASLVFVDAEHAGLPLGRPPLRLDADPDAPPADPAGLPGSRLEDPWMILYTSGSTGRPKGAMLTHGQLHWNALNTTLACDLRAESSTLTFAPLFHTGGMNCLSTPLLHRGGRVVLVPRLDAGEALRLVRDEQITHLMGVPTIYAMLAEHPEFGPEVLASVQDAICGGAALPASLLRRYLELGVPLRQGFGMTEVGPNCFSMPHARIADKMIDAPAEGTVDGTGGARPETCVGRPIHHLEARIVRPDGTECAPGEPGELLLRGPVVCGGYWEDPEATARSIVDGWFHTGDLLSRDAEGFFYVRGRLKEMYISGGENVYPAEVEGVLASYEGVGQVAVVGVPDARWGEVGHAWLEPLPGATLDEAGLRAFLDGRLARFKLPKQLFIRPELPRTGSGKIDKSALKRASLAGAARVDQEAS